MRRLGPRPLDAALAAAAGKAAPSTLLARVQVCWAAAAGEAIAAEAAAVAEQSGTLTVECRSAVWANELELLAPDLVERLNAALGASDSGPVTRLRVRATGGR